MRGKIDYWPTALRPDKTGLKLATATDQHSHGRVGSHFLPPVGSASLRNRVEENTVVERRKTAMKREYRLDIRVIVRGFALQIRSEKPELFRYELLEWVLKSILWPVSLPTQALPRLIALEDLHRETERRRIRIHD